MKAGRSAAYLTAAAMAVSLLGGCGTTSSASDNSALYTTESPVTVAGGKTITFFVNQNGTTALKIFNDAATKFEADTGIKVSFANFVQDSNQGSKSYDEVAEERIESDEPDDLYILNADVLQDEVEKGNIAPLTDLPGTSDLTEDAIEGSKIKGVQYCMPMFMSAYSFYSNTDILKANGLSVPTDLPEFLDCCKKLKAAGITPFQGNKWWTEVLVLAGGMSDFYFDKGSVDDLNSGKTKISTYMEKGFQLVSDMDAEGYMDLAGTYDVTPGDDFKAMLAGKCAFATNMAATIAEDYANGDNRNHYTVSGVPLRNDGSVVLMNPDVRVCVCSKGKNAEAAKKFVTYLTSKEVTDRFLERDGRYSIRKDAVISSPAVMKGVDECVSAGRTMPCQNYAINVEQWGNTCEILWKMMQDGMTAEEAGAAFDELQVEADK
jgi:raffinose/stachyose/melibiose transport system substrate-binding protein